MTDEAGVKPFLSTWFYRVFNRVSTTPIVPGGSDFRLLDRVCVDAINAFQSVIGSCRLDPLDRLFAYRREL